MSEQLPVNVTGQSDAALAVSAPAQTASKESVQNVKESFDNGSSAETVNTDNSREQLIPRARFDQVNNELKRFKSRESDYQAYDQFESALKNDPDLAEAITQVIQKRRQVSQPVETPVQQTVQSKADPVVNKLAQEVFLMKAETNVNRYQAQCTDLLRQVQIPEHQMPMYREAIEQRVLQKLQGNLAVYDAGVVAQAVEETKQYFGQYLNPPKQQEAAPQIPVTRPNAPIEVQRFRSRDERTAYLASALRASNKG